MNTVEIYSSIPWSVLNLQNKQFRVIWLVSVFFIAIDEIAQVRTVL